MRSLARLIVLAALVLVVNFLLPRALPGDPLAHTLAGSADAPVALAPEARARLSAYYGLDRPLGDQFLAYAGGLARGDLGFSIRFQRPVLELVAARAPWSLLLGGLALLLAAVGGALLGIRAAWRHGRREESVLTAILVLLGALPEFVVGLALLVLLAVWLPLLPASGALSPFPSCVGLGAAGGCVVDAARHLVLPLLTLVLAHVPGFYLVMRAAALAQLEQGYLTAARAKGLAEITLALRHLARNALIPLAALFGARLGFVVGGVLVVETVFAYPGIGQLAYEAIIARDYPVLQAIFLIAGLAILLANALADLALPRLDPRLRTFVSVR